MGMKCPIWRSQHFGVKSIQDQGLWHRSLLRRARVGAESGATMRFVSFNFRSEVEDPDIEVVLPAARASCLAVSLLPA